MFAMRFAPFSRLLPRLLLVLLSSPGFSASALPEFSAHLWRTDDGLPHNVVQAITQTRDGYLWAGTRAGLARFDGVRFTAVTLSPNIPRPSVSSLCAGREGGLWIGTVNDGVFYLTNGAVSHLGKAEGLTSTSIAQIQEGADGSIWIAGREGLAKWQDGRIQILPDTVHPANPLFSLCLDHEGGIWVGSSRGVQLLKDQQVLSFRTAKGHPLRAIRSLFCDAGGTVWIGGGDGVTVFKDETFTYYPNGQGPTAIVTAILRDHAGNVWVGTQGGLSRFAEGVFHEEPPQEEASGAIYALFEDREGSLWVGSAEGLERLTAKSFMTYTKEQGLSQNAISSVCAGRDGSIWIGTWGGGLNQLKNDSITIYNRSNGLSSDFVVGLQEARDGTLWVGSAYAHGSQGLDLLKSGQIIKRPLVGEQPGLALTALVEDQQGNMWAGSHYGLGCFTQGTVRSYASESASSNTPINALCMCHDGSLWIGTENGMARWSKGHLERLGSDKSVRPFVLSLYEDSGGELWIGTLGDGLIRFARETFTIFSPRQGLASDSIYSILEDSRHNLWLHGNQGLFRVGKDQFDKLDRAAIQSLNCIGYGKNDGILGSDEWQEATQLTQPAQPAACIGADGRFWFRTSQGVAVTDPNKIRSNELPPPVVIEEIIADRKTIAASDFLKIAPGRGEVEIHYTALSLKAPEKNRFHYKLEGSDLDWVDAGNRRTAYYNHLAPGSYSFRVIACNNDGVWNETGAVIGLKLTPHLWQTWWFLSLCGLLAAGVIGGSARYVTRRRMQQKLERLRQLNAIETERARIARDMHDELGAKLTRISFQGAIAIRSLSNPALAKEEIGKITHTARALVSSLDEIVWAVDPENDSLENLAGYIVRYAGDFFQNSPINCEFYIPANLPEYRLASDVRHNVFLAVKEALTNVLKHSHATQVQIRLTLGVASAELTILDNGRGLNSAGPAETPGRNGHGLANLRHRLELINGSCTMTSEPGGGTRVTFVIPLPGGGVHACHPII
jgi:ligand-binding sensor domain-containing protein/signal transduction histidine kinase